MVVQSLPLVESVPVSGGAPLVRQSEGGPGSGRHPEGDEHPSHVVKAISQMAQHRPRSLSPGQRRDLAAAGYGTLHPDHSFSLNDKGQKLYYSMIKQTESAPVASGQCHDEADAGCQCPDCCAKKKENGVPSQLLHDETGKVPVKSFRDDIQRKTSLRKVMGKHEPPEKEGGPGSGRHPGGGRGRFAPAAPSSGSVADVASQHGFKPTRRKDQGQVSTQIYEHPESGDQIRHTTGQKLTGSGRYDQWEHYTPVAGAPKGTWTFAGKGQGPDLASHLAGKTSASEAVSSSFNDDPAGMDDTSDLDLGMLDPDNQEEIPTGNDQLWTKEEVNYRYSGDKYESCGNCVHFKFPGACEIIAGPVRPVDVCDKFEAEDEDKGSPFGWQGQQSEDEDAHSVDTQTVPSTLVPLRDKNVVQAVVAEGGPASAWGMVTSEGGPGSGRVPGIHVNGVQNFPGKEPHVVFTDKITKSTMMIPQSQATPENMQNKAVAKRREFYGDPTERRQAMKKTAESEAIKALAKRLAETAFDTLKNKLAHKKGIYSPAGLAAKIGRDKMGKAAFDKKAAAGRKKADEAVGEFMKVGPQKDAGDASGKMAYEPTQRNKVFKGMRDSGKTVAPTT
jgi:hypothetical protein